jgi:hypothetical protein
MHYQTTIPFARAIRDVVLVSASVPLPFGPPIRPEAFADLQVPATVPPEHSPSPAEVEDRQKIDQLLIGLTELGRDLRQQQQQRLREMQQAAIELAVAVASRLVHAQIAAGDYPIENLVRHVVNQLGAPQAVTVVLNPADLALLKRRLGDEPLLEDNPNICLLGDPTLNRGDCRAETADVHLLAQLEEQINELRETLLRSLPESEADRHNPAEHRLHRHGEADKRRQTLHPSPGG